MNIDAVSLTRAFVSAMDIVGPLLSEADIDDAPTPPTQSGGPTGGTMLG